MKTKKPIGIYNKDAFILQDRKKIKIFDADTVTLLKYFAKFKDRHFSVADVSDESICEW